MEELETSPTEASPESAAAAENAVAPENAAQPQETAAPENTMTSETAAAAEEAAAAEDAAADAAAEEGAEEGVAEAPAAADAPALASEDTHLEDERLKAIIEAIVYVTDEPLSAQQIAAALGHPLDKIRRLLDALVEDYARPERGLSVREVAGGYKMSTKAEHHEAVRAFVKKLTPPLKLSLAALETLAVVAYKQPVTAPEIMDIRGVQGAGVLKTLLDRKLIAEGGRKKVVGQPILYKTTKEFLVQFGLKDLGELPTIKEFEELGRMEIVEEEPPVPEPSAPSSSSSAPSPSTPEASLETPASPEPPSPDSQPSASPEAKAEPETQPEAAAEAAPAETASSENA